MTEKFIITLMALIIGTLWLGAETMAALAQTALAYAASLDVNSITLLSCGAIVGWLGATSLQTVHNLLRVSVWLTVVVAGWLWVVA